MKGDTGYLNIKKLHLSINILQQWGYVENNITHP